MMAGFVLLQACGGATGAAPDVASAPSGGSDVGHETTGESSAAVTAAPAGPPATPRPLPAFCANAKADAPPPGAQAKLVKDGFVFVEGPVWSDVANAFFFSEMDFNKPGPKGPPSRIHKLVLPASVDVFIAESGSNGLAVDAEGLVACTHDTQTLSRYDLKTRARTTFVADYQGKHFNSPNDVALHSQGHAYFTDPDWQIGERPNETGMTGVYARSASGQVSLVDGKLERPNGISLSPDETRLYVGAGNGVVNVYPVLADGSIGAGQKFADVPEPDGMAVDCLGRLYVASHGPGEVVVLSTTGEVVSKIKVAPRATNVAFGGANHDTLLITAGSGVYSLAAPVAGFPY